MLLRNTAIADHDTNAKPLSAARTLLVSENFPPTPGGSGRWFWEIYRRLPADRYFMLAGNPADARQFDSTHALSIERTSLLSMKHWGIAKPSATWHYWKAIRQIRRLTKRHGIERLHVGRTLPEGVMALAMNVLYRMPYVCYVHGEDVTMAATSRELSALVRRVLHRAERVVANSHNTESLLLQQWNVPRDRLVVMHPGVDTKQFTPAAAEAAIRRELGWQDRRVLLTVGRLQRRKGHDHLIQALPQIRSAIPNVLYSILSDGEERPRLERLVEELGLGECVQFRGRAEDDEIIRCYQQCDLFVLPNRTEGVDIEGFGMVLLEAQACGKPVVAGDSGGTRETMQVPETGLIISCDSPDPMVGPIVELLQDEPRRKTMGEAGRSWVCAQFDWQQLAQRAATLFGEPATRLPHVDA